MIENIQYKFADNHELSLLANSFIDTYLHSNDTEND